ncbi:MAG: hypothetical protein Kow00133_02140 [Amphiplicatus sp.]
MTILPAEFFLPRRVDGMAIRLSERKDGRFEIFAWSGPERGWEPAKGVDAAEFMSARLASPAFLDRIGVPADDPARAIALPTKFE